MAVDEDPTTIQEQQEQDGTLKDQQQQKEAEEENAAEASNDAAMVEVNGSGEANNNEEGEEEVEEEEEDEEEEEEGGGEEEDDEEEEEEEGGGGGGEEEEEEEDEEEDEEEEDSEDLYMLLHPFTKEQMHALAKQAIEKHPDLAEYGRRVALYGAIPVDPEIFQKEIEYYEDNPVDSEEEEDLDLENAPVEKLLEIFNARELEAIIKKGVKKYPDIAEIVRQQADVNPAHRKVLVHTHGLGWDATAESLTSVFGKHGEIEDCEYVTDKHSGKFKCCAFILFKHGSGARKALKQPLKKIGNRTTVCKFASSGGHVCWYLYDDVESAKNALEELHKVVDGYHQQQQHHHQPTGPAVGGYNPGLPQQGVQALYASLISRSGQKDALELENFLGWLGGAPVNQAEPVPVAYCNEAAMNLGNQLGMPQ